MATLAIFRPRRIAGWKSWLCHSRSLRTVTWAASTSWLRLRTFLQFLLDGLCQVGNRRSQSVQQLHQPGSFPASLPQHSHRRGRIRRLHSCCRFRRAQRGPPLSSRSSSAPVAPLLQSAGPHQNQCLPPLSLPLQSGLGKGRTYATTPPGKRRNTSGS